MLENLCFLGLVRECPGVVVVGECILYSLGQENSWNLAYSECVGQEEQLFLFQQNPHEKSS